MAADTVGHVKAAHKHVTSIVAGSQGKCCMLPDDCCNQSVQAQTANLPGAESLEGSIDVSQGLRGECSVLRDLSEAVYLIHRSNPAPGPR